MNQQKINETKTLIDDFMGESRDPLITSYNGNWAALMPVANKIQFELGHFMSIKRNRVSIHLDDEESKIIIKPFGYEDSDNYFNMILKAIVRFIKWHNKNK